MSRMTGMISVALAGGLLASAAFAQDPAPPGVEPDPGDLARYDAANVDPAFPFGDIDVTAAGTTREEVLAFLRSLTGAQVLETIQRCHVISPYMGGDFEENPPAAGEAGAPAAGAAGAPAGGAAAAPPAAAAAPAPGPAYPAEAAALCTMVNAIVFNLEDPAAAPAADVPPAPGGAAAPPPPR
ncbi:MAG: hypothetical protein AB7S41_18195 [Parvibaculaceae bacterium]